MKIRQGFVSNSSTTSFCIYGTYLGSLSIDFVEYYKKMKKNAPKKFNKLVKSYLKSWRKERGELLQNIDSLDDEQMDDFEALFSDDPYEFFEELDLECHSHYGEGYYIGTSWDCIGDDQTGLQFKEDVERKLKEIFDDDIEFGTHEEAWRD